MMRAFTLFAAIFVIAQIGEAQNSAQNNTPQPSQGAGTTERRARSEGEAKKERSPQRQERRYQQQQQQKPQAQQQPPQPLQQTKDEQPQQEQLQPSQQQQPQHKTRRAQQSKPVPASVLSYEKALEKCQRDRHPRVWWAQHYAVIVLVSGGYYYFDSGYWYPCWGYDPNYEAYDYDGPIYTYGNLLPDQVILNVQRVLADLGYYGGPLSGSLSAATRYAISDYQRDNGLVINGIVDAPLVYSLGLV